MCFLAVIFALTTALSCNHTIHVGVVRRYMDLYDYQWYPLPIAVQPAVFPNRPGGFFGASLAVAPSASSDATYWLFGGQNANTYFSELWTYATRTCSWVLYAYTQATDKVPCGRGGHVSYFDALSGTPRLFLFGGQSDNGFLSGAQSSKH